MTSLHVIMAAETIQQFLCNRSFANDNICYHVSMVLNLCSATLDKEKVWLRQQRDLRFLGAELKWQPKQIFQLPDYSSERVSVTFLYLTSKIPVIL
jgi:hypothetical protein